MLLRRAYGLAWSVVPVHCCCLCCPRVAGSIELLCPDACPCFSKKNILFITHAIYWVSVSLPILWSRCALLLRAVPQGTHVQDHDNFLINPFDITGCLCILLMPLPHDTLCGICHPNRTSMNVFSRTVRFQSDHRNPQVLKALSLSAYLTGTPGLCLPSSPLFSTSLRCFMFPFSPFSSYLGLIKSFITSPSSTPSHKHC